MPEAVGQSTGLCRKKPGFLGRTGMILEIKVYLYETMTALSNQGTKASYKTIKKID